ncbi:MAG: T9SS type A sorting domain-containing protein, partial [Ignavibacteriaceae bacterium]|nr:T9SS type A sorting domain-containing protein [Ignavibacteriaceae bacterium]
LFDDGTNGDLVANDKIFSKDILFPAYTSLGAEYKYGLNFGLATNQGSNDNEAGVGSNHTFGWQINYVSATAVDTFGRITVANLINVVTGVKEIDNNIPNNYNMSQNYPNPFNPSTSIQFSIPEAGMVRMVVYNAIGQEVAVLLDGEKAAGNYEVSFDAAKLPSGIYLYTIQSGSFTQTRKMMLLK